eukprot:TRINITY_DN16015_c0_g1_i1.p1 TRINITY_DN16015_c0_g1~~TRINITY_DN16015_c0_g1_i1.p1  ORF type:complete len:400 (-),score=45.08 TRINITY_DN16015_c0_g1_i1:139-1287(-)
MAVESEQPRWLLYCAALVVMEVIVLVVWTLVVLLRRWRGKEDKDAETHPKGSGASGPGPAQEGDRSKGHLVIVNAAPCGPKGQSSRSDCMEATEFDSGICHGAWLCIHKPTNDPERIASGDYPYADHFHTRKRLWEFRLQLKFREPVDGEVIFGCEQDRYYHVPTVEKYISSTVIGLLRTAAGDAMYQTHGDDPRHVRGETERPQIMFPLWVMDQLIVSEEGEEPPDLTDPEFSSFGVLRAEDRRKHREVLKRMEFRPGPTFTFGFWCIAQFVDAIGWKVPARGVIPQVKLNEIGTHPPCYITMYALRPQEEWSNVQGKRDTRHLDSRKIYIWRVALWSSLLPPESNREQELLSKGATDMKKEASPGRNSLSRRGNGWCVLC